MISTTMSRTPSTPVSCEKRAWSATFSRYFGAQAIAGGAWARLTTSPGHFICGQQLAQ